MFEQIGGQLGEDLHQGMSSRQVAEVLGERLEPVQPGPDQPMVGLQPVDGVLELWGGAAYGREQNRVLVAVCECSVWP